MCQNARMAKLIYSMITSLDGYTEDEHGDFGWGAPEDEAVHSYINELAASVGTYLYGRRMYDTMLYWETAHAIPDQFPRGAPPRLVRRTCSHRRRRLSIDVEGSGRVRVGSLQRK